MREYGEACRATPHVSHEQARVLRASAQCRTAALGGPVEACETCGTERISSNSCRHRHCPQCQGAARAQWLAAAEARLLPVAYFHVVFTLPPLLTPLRRVNQRLLYTLLLQAAAQTRQEFARDPTHLGAALGLTVVLPTWGQTLPEHVHVHGLVTGGGLSAEGTHWRPSRRFLFAVTALSRVFRGQYLAGLTRLRAQPRLGFAGVRAPVAEDAAWATFLRQLHRPRWVVYAKPPWGGPEQVLKYLSRYTHRVAISNARLVFVGDGVIHFRYKDYAAGETTKSMELQAEECLRRFVLQGVPPHCVRIRHFGRLATRARRDQCTRCRHLLAVAAATAVAALPRKNRETPAAGVEQGASSRGPACRVGRWRRSEI